MNLEIILSSSISMLLLALVFCRVQYDICYFDKRSSNEFRFRTFTKRSLDHCMEECLKRSRCQAVGYRRLALFCELFSDSSAMSSEPGHVTISRGHMYLQDNKPILREPTCNGSKLNDECKECDPPKPVKNGKFLGNVNWIGAKKGIICDDGYIEKNYKRAIRCKPGGVWNYVPYCRKKNRCELHNIFCGNAHSCCNVSGTLTCRSVPEFIDTSACPLTEYTWIPLRCTKILVGTNLVSRDNATKNCRQTHNARVLDVRAHWKIDFISGVLQHCQGFSGFTYWTKGTKNGSLVDPRIYDKPVPTDANFWSENIINDGNIGGCIGLMQNNVGTVGNYRYAALNCDDMHRYICEKTI